MWSTRSYAKEAYDAARRAEAQAARAVELLAILMDDTVTPKEAQTRMESVLAEGVLI